MINALVLLARKVQTDTAKVVFYILLLYIELFNSFLIGRKRTVNFRNQRPLMSRSRVIVSRSWVISNEISKGNHVNFARFVLFAVSEEAETWLPSFCVQCTIKQLLDSVFVIKSRIIKVSVRVISLSLRLRLITRTSTLIILDITKTSSNNCI